MDLKAGQDNLLSELQQVKHLCNAQMRHNEGGSYATTFLGGTAGDREHSRDVQLTTPACNLGKRMVSAREVPPCIPALTVAQQAPSRIALFDATNPRAAARIEEIALEVVGDIGKLLIPIKHMTAVQKLLRWPSIQELLLENPVYNEDYLMKLEETCGLLRVYGRGEGLNLGDNNQPGLASTAPNATSVNSEEQALSSITPLEGLWNTGFRSSAGGNAMRVPHEGIGELNLNGTLMIDLETCFNLLESYIDHIHILHPFLPKAWLTHEVNLFAKSANPTEQDCIHTSFVPSDGLMPNNARHKPAAPPNQAIKRKHSTSTTSGPPTESCSGSNASSRMLFQPLLKPSITTAVVLLVMALGEICEWKDALPGPVPDRTQLSRQRSFRFGHMSQMPSSEGLSSFEKGSNNADVIPGMAYYAYATQILESTHSGVKLIHVHANLLAGLYAGQLARVFESWDWIAQACRAFRVLTEL